MKANEIVERVLAAMGAGSDESQYEGWCGGDGEIETERVLVCHTPSYGMLRAAAADGRKLVITREHPFYSHGTWYAGGTAEALEGDEVAAKKREVIEREGMAVYRLSSKWDRFRPKSQAAALARAMGWDVVGGATGEAFRGVTCDVEATTVGGVAARVSDYLGVKPVRGVGDPESVVRRVSVLPGMVDVATYMEALRDEQVDCVLAGEANEWEGAPYVKDAIDSGRRLGVVYAGFAATGWPGMEPMSDYIGGVVEGVDVDWDTTVPPAQFAGDTCNC